MKVLIRHLHRILQLQSSLLRKVGCRAAQDKGADAAEGGKLATGGSTIHGEMPHTTAMCTAGSRLCTSDQAGRVGRRQANGKQEVYVLCIYAE